MIEIPCRCNHDVCVPLDVLYTRFRGIFSTRTQRLHFFSQGEERNKELMNGSFTFAGNQLVSREVWGSQK